MSLTPEDLAAELPEPQPGEPENLRQDILDELADHLHCALSDEQRRMACEGQLETEEAEQVARGRVIERFGNPVQIACQLWWDAMWEKVMSQRVQTISVVVGVLVVGVLVVVGMFFLMWGELRNSRAQLNAQLDESRNMQKQLMDELTRVRQQPQSLAAPQPAEWNNLSVVCVSADDEKTPVEGVKVSMKSTSKNNSGIPPGEGTTDKAGYIDFGQVLYGQYYLSIEMPNGFSRYLSVSVRPGQDKDVRLVCPTGTGERPIQFTASAVADWEKIPSSTLNHLQKALSLNPDIPVAKQIWTIYQFQLVPPVAEDWSLIKLSFFSDSAPVRRYVAANQAGDVVPLTSFEDRFLQRDDELEIFLGGVGRTAIGRATIPEISKALSTGKLSGSISWPVGTYQQGLTWHAIADTTTQGDEFWLLDSWYEANRGDDRLVLTGALPGTALTRFGSVTDELLNEFLGLKDDLPRAGTTAASNGQDAYGMGGYPGGNMMDYAGYGGGNSIETFTVTLESQAEFTLPEMPRQLSDLMATALFSRLPAEMRVGEIAGRTNAPILNRERLGYDLVWSGITVSENGDIEQEEHVLLNNIDVFASLSGNRLEVALTPAERSLLVEFCRDGEISVRPAGMQARRQPVDEIDEVLLSRLARTRPMYFRGGETPRATSVTRTETLTVSHDSTWKPDVGLPVDVFLKLEDGTTIPGVRAVFVETTPAAGQLRSDYDDGVTGSYVLQIPLSNRNLGKYPEMLAFRAKLWIAPTTWESGRAQVETNNLEQRVNSLLKEFAAEAKAPEETTPSEE